MNYTLIAQAAESASKPSVVVPAPPTFPTGAQISSFFYTFGASIVVVFVLYILLFYLLRSFLRRTEKDTALFILGILQIPAIAIFILASLKLSLTQLGSGGIINLIDRGLTAFLILGFTYGITLLFTEAAVYYLKDYARKTEAVWDDVLIPLLQNFIPLITYLIGISLFFSTIGVDLTGIGLAIGSITVVLGLAVKDILSDFFSGLVLLVDTPFRFGDVISMPDGSIAIIKHIGIRVTKLYLINEHCEVYTPNTTLGGQNIVNLSRPTTHYAYTIKVSVRVDADAVVATNILQQIILGHPDTLGDIDEKLQYLDNFAALTEAKDDKLSKKEAGRLRLLIEKDVNTQLQKIEQAFEDFVREVKKVEKGGLNSEELKILQKNYLEILNIVGLVVITERKGKRLRSRLEEQEPTEKQTLIGLIRQWYQTWLKDPDLVIEDQHLLPDEWEQKIELLKIKLNKLFQKIASPGVDETRLDDYSLKFLEWLHDSFKESNTAWKEPQVQLTDIQGSAMQFSVRFYVDNIQLEHWRRGNRVQNEVRREMVRRLRQAYIYTLG
ncbi:mechanosensitive ion channel protein [Nostoc sp. 'Peltigera membranacea cyanobiont' 210A]|uniref:mechanosensitive ion channel family protein n=1 Tax=Nostoc sp. 'Peltigera membranacea cyanobiont' 210A TaxID=2014529 RepID=UPI000B95167C|nr:mechanosensitive ion channel family protein [Nostoc sp. 'Peltigera membranacea cyanobiont' 210A]OYD93885.1 mechanosensitive ion channel protein [Nostoc sp. 'Peltigera membranacea cyanobiont' 210A]